MKKKTQVIGLIIFMIVSVVFDYQKGEEIPQETKSYSVVILEGAFLKQGEYRYEGSLTVQQLVDRVGVLSNANMDCLNMDMKIKDESSLYLPVQNQKAISLNRATQEELMTLKGIGEKTSLKIIEYRQKQPFLCLEDIMNISGIGEKTYIKLRDNLCL